jgi:methylglutaconyl-CoA hydratase
MPSLALVKGAVFGGAVGLVAACDYALAWEGARFCLSEAKIGLIPAVILPYLARKLPASHLHRQVLSARVFTANEAIEMGLVQAVYPADLMEEHLHEEVNSLLSASPEAQSTYKSLFSELSRLQWQQGALTAAAIAEIRASSMGQAGLGAYFQKAPPPWILRVPKSACLGLA